MPEENQNPEENQKPQNQKPEEQPDVRFPLDILEEHERRLTTLARLCVRLFESAATKDPQLAKLAGEVANLGES